MSKTKISIELSKEIEAVLVDNKTSREDILKHENINAEVTHGILPYQMEDGTKTLLLQ